MINVHMKGHTRQAAYDAGFAAGLYDIDPNDGLFSAARRKRLAAQYVAKGKAAVTIDAVDPRQKAVADIFLEGYAAGCASLKSPIRLLVNATKDNKTFIAARNLQLETC